MSGLMRSKITPDCSKLVVATTNGYIIIIHELNLTAMASDMKTFRVCYCFVVISFSSYILEIDK